MCRLNDSGLVIGVLGGMGTYATIHLFQQYAEVFPAEKEWDRPRIIIDNRCTMPSRVRAFLYNEKKDQLVSEMADSLQNLLNSGCSRILLACNTSHLFLSDVYKIIPELECKVVNIIDACADQLCAKGIKEVFLLGTEGTIESRVYHNALGKNGIRCIAPTPNEYHSLRDCIEAVKQNKYTEEIKTKFCELVNRYDKCILGCTELPILYEKYKADIICGNVYDPLYIALNNLHREYMD